VRLLGALESLRELGLGWKAKGPLLPIALLRAPTAPVREADMSDRRGLKSSEQSYDADRFVRCAACWRWFDRNNSVLMAEHRGPLPHPRAAWADEDE
jgi:hypothetical protein